MDLEADGGGARVGGVGVVGGLGTVEPDLKAVTQGADTEVVPLAVLGEAGDAFAVASPQIDIDLGPSVKISGHRALT